MKMLRTIELHSLISYIPFLVAVFIGRKATEIMLANNWEASIFCWILLSQLSCSLQTFVEGGHPCLLNKRSGNYVDVSNLSNVVS